MVATALSQRITYLMALVFFIGISICGSFLNRIRGGWEPKNEPLPQASPDNILTHDGTNRLIMGLGTGGAAMFAVLLRRPLWMGLVAFVGVTILSYFCYFVGWGSYFSVGNYDFEKDHIRVGVFDVLVGYPEPHWSTERKMQRDIVAMSLRGLVQTVPAGLVLVLCGGSWVGMWSGVLMGPLYVLGYHLGADPTKLDADGQPSPFSEGTASGEVYWGAWSILMTVWPLLAAAARGRMSWSADPKGDELNMADAETEALDRHDVPDTGCCRSCLVAGAVATEEIGNPRLGHAASEPLLTSVGHDHFHSSEPIDMGPDAVPNHHYQPTHHTSRRPSVDLTNSQLCCTAINRVGFCGNGPSCGCLPAVDDDTDAMPASQNSLFAIHIPLILLEILWIVSIASYATLNQEDQRNMHQSLVGFGVAIATTIALQIVFAFQEKSTRSLQRQPRYQQRASSLGINSADEQEDLPNGLQATWNYVLQLPPSSRAILSCHNISLALCAIATAVWAVTVAILLIIVAADNKHTWGRWPNSRP